MKTLAANQLLKNTKTGYTDTYDFWLELVASESSNNDLYSIASSITASQTVQAMIITRELVAA